MKVLVAAIALMISPFIYAQENVDQNLFTDAVQKEKFLGDFDEMLGNRLIRVLVTTNKTNYFIDQASQSGITYEFFEEFEKKTNEKIESGHLKVNIVYIPVNRDQLITALLEGRGDIAAASLTITPERLAQVDFTDPLVTGVDEIIVASSETPVIDSIDQLSGQQVFVRKSSSYYDHLQALNETFSDEGKAPIDIQLAAEHLEDEDLLEMVNSNLLPIIVIDDYLAEFWSGVYTDLKLYPEIKLNTDGEIGWMIRKNSPQLMQALNSFVKDHKLGTLFGNIMKKRYFSNPEYTLRAFNTENDKRFSKTAELFKKYSQTYGFDWLMIAALSFQESGIDQSVVSPVGAVGVMQILPATAAGDPINISGVDQIDNNIHAGVKYLRWVYDRYFNDDAQLDDLNKMLFTFASYNAGPAKVRQLREQTAEMGLDPNTWFDNVEVTAAKVIGRETVQYVSNIYKYYFAYTLITESRNKTETAG